MLHVSSNEMFTLIGKIDINNQNIKCVLLNKTIITRHILLC